MLAMPVPVIGRAAEDAVWLDVRTIDAEDLALIAEQFGEVLA
jgi:seryl-tRNA(Sec) selenium transferase